MNGIYLIINAGSSSLKFSLYNMPEKNEIANGTFERIGEDMGAYSISYCGMKLKRNIKIPNHFMATNLMLDEIVNIGIVKNLYEIKGVGHRVLHGGEYYSSATLIDEDVLANIVSLTKLGPLHHPGEIAAINVIKDRLPNVDQVAEFDTAFHQTMPEENYIYGGPIDWYKEYGVRRYGFHGSSHKYITKQAKEKYGCDRIISCHIGSGASVCCIKDGKSINTSMGLTPLDGVIMGTRSGAIDPSILSYISKETGKSLDEITYLLNNGSGLLGLCGKNDFRDVEELANSGNHDAQLAIKLFEKSVINYIAQYYFELNGKVDAIVFTAGVGENASRFRKDVVNALSDVLNIKLDENENDSIAKFKNKHEGIITTDDSKLKVIVIPTDEEAMILEDTYNLINNKDNPRKLGLVRGA